MSDTRQREQWAEHLRDEQTARDTQQVSAGGTHSPVIGPLPHSVSDLEAAVLAERERCAAIADTWASDARLRQAFSDFTQWELGAATEVAHAIARAIRGECSR